MVAFGGVEYCYKVGDGGESLVMVMVMVVMVMDLVILNKLKKVGDDDTVTHF